MGVMDRYQATKTTTITKNSNKQNTKNKKKQKKDANCIVVYMLHESGLLVSINTQSRYNISSHITEMVNSSSNKSPHPWT